MASELLLTHIKALVLADKTGKSVYRGAEMAQLPLLRDAWLHIKNGLIADFGLMDAGVPTLSADSEVWALDGRLVWPAWCDSHSHAVYAAPRHDEFAMRLRGKSYADIAAAGGGILNSARRLNAMSEDSLLEVTIPRVRQLIQEGTGALEIKSGYGLSLESELKMLRVARRIGRVLPIEVRTTFLGAHAIPSGFKNRKAAYLDMVIQEMLPAVVAEGLADFVDIFCEAGYFSVSDMERLIRAGAAHGLPAKVHVNQFQVLGGIPAAVRLGALSVDHLEVLDDADVESLRTGQTWPVLLPNCSLFLDIPFAPARRLIDAGLPVVLASDFNPGSSPSGNMSLVVSLACLRMGMLPEEAIIAATIHGAAAMGLADTCGSIAPGKWANLWISKPMSGIEALPYHFGHSFVDRALWHGQPVESGGGWF